MYNGFFGFKEKPFKLIPNPEFLFLGKSHEEALAHLTYAISQGDGFVEITGEVGSGKTTLCRVFLEDLDKSADVAFIFNSKLTSLQLLKAIHTELGIKTQDSDIVDLTHSLNQFLLKKKSKGRSVILLIDEAQHLGRETLEQLRLLSNLETTKSKLLQIILVGQPELGEILDAFDMRQLRQRINLSCHILPLTLEETQNYIDHRVNVASRKTLQLFTPKAKKIIYTYSNGIPRQINIICDRSLLTAYGLNKKKVSSDIANIAVKELYGPKANLLKSDSPKRQLFWPIFSICVSILFLLMLFNYLPHPWALKTKNHTAVQKPVQETISLKNTPVHNTPEQNRIEKPIHFPEETIRPIPTPTLTVPSFESPSPDPVEKQNAIAREPGETMPVLIKTITTALTRDEALLNILSLWGNSLETEPQNISRQIGNDKDFFRMAALHHNFLMHHIEQGISWIEKFNLPAIVELKTGPNDPARYIVINKITPDGLYLFSSPDHTTRFKISPEDLYAQSKKNLFIACKNIFGHTRIIEDGSPKFSVLSIKLILRQLGYSTIDLTSAYNDEVKTAVKTIQAKYGLTQDGLVGPLTKLALIQEKNESSTPFLGGRLQ